ncbi:MAG: PQQ-binding-like beta-propeller repeat protein [bacterium]|nr:PQQ-binding-like beta-propeller repeat protein [bacterium]
MLRLLLTLLLVLAGSCKTQHPAASLDHPWPTFCHDNQRTNRSHLPAPSRPVLKWRVQLSPAGQRISFGLVRGPVVDASNNCYVLTDRVNLHCVDAQGKITWTRKVPRSFYSPIICRDGSLVCNGESLVRIKNGAETKLKGFDLDFGKAYSREDSFEHALELDDGDLLCMMNKSTNSSVLNKNVWNSQLLNLASTGRVRWKSSSVGILNLTLTPITTDGELVVVIRNKAELFDVGGLPLATASDVAIKPWIPPMLNRDSIFVVTKARQGVAKYDRSFALSWSYPVAPSKITTYALGLQGELFLSLLHDISQTQRDSALLALDSSGTELWRRELPGGKNAALTVDSSGILLASLAMGEILALNPANGKDVWRIKVPDSYGSAIIGNDRTLFVLDRMGGLNAIGEGP